MNSSSRRVPSLSTTEVCQKCGKVHARPHNVLPNIIVPTCRAHRKRTDPPEPCLMFLRRGSLVCDYHGGATRRIKTAAAQRAALADAGKKLGVAVEVDPTQALLHSLWLAYGDMAFWSNATADLERGGVDALGNGLVVRGAQGSSMPHVYVTQYNDAQVRVARLAGMAKAAGIEERKVQILEEQANTIAEFVRRVLAKAVIAFSLDREQANQMRDLFREQLALMEPVR